MSDSTQTYLIATLLSFFVLSCSSDIVAQDQPAGPIDFYAQVEPILRIRCFQCHGPKKQKGHLRLDLRDAAAAGGDSGVSIVDIGPDKSILLAKITSTDPEEIMPPPGDHDPLTPAQIDRLTRWVEAGSQWPERKDPPPLWQTTAATIWNETVARYAPFLVAWLIAVVCIEIIRRFARRKLAAAGNDPDKVSYLTNKAASLGASHRLGALAIVVMVMFYLDNRDLRARVEALASAPPKAVINETSVFGFPPVPFKSESSAGLSRTYYRGNCERDEKLFNGGHYLTATFKIALVDEDGKPIAVGDSVTDRSIGLRFELVRAPHTPDSLFTDVIVSRLCLSSQLPGYPLPERDDVPVALSVVEPDQRWQAVYTLPNAIDDDAKSQHLTGVIYLYHKAEMRGDSLIAGTRHYGMKYDLVLENGRVAEGSDLFMNALFWTPAIKPPTHPDGLPFAEWFASEPIPPIVGGNTKDPKLLGVQEHLGPQD